MNILSAFGSWWDALLNRERIDGEVEAELQFHIDTYAQELIESGISAKDAQRKARAEHGHISVQKELYRSAIGLRPLQEIGGDLQYGLRSFARKPTFALIAVLSLALGIGATTAIFSLIYATLLHPFPYAGADRIVNPALIDQEHPQVPTWFALMPDQFETFSKAKSIDSVIGFLNNELTATSGELPEDVQAAYVTANVSSFLSVPAELGRGIQPSDVSVDRPPAEVVVLDYKYWRHKYNSDPQIVGRVLQLNHEDYTIVGVMPQRFAFTSTVGNVDVYIPWTADRCPNIFPLVKLKPGVSLAAANAEFQPLLKQFKRETPRHFPDTFQVSVQPIIEPYLRRDGHTLALLFASVTLLLLIGCANCSILLLARGESRQQELAIRSAIGASRFRIVRQLLVEALAISFTGAVVGAAFSYWLAKLPLQLMPDAFPQEAAITVNLPILAFAIVLALATGLISGLFPALRLSRPNLSQVIQSTSRTVGVNTSRRVLSLLITAQIALTFILLGTAGAAIAGFLKITSTRLGYEPHNVMVIGIPLKRDSSKDWAARANYIDQVRGTAASVPGVLDVAVINRGIPPAPPFGGLGTEGQFEILGVHNQKEQLAIVSLVSPEFFATLQIPLLKGRLWDQSENRRGDFVAVINQALSDRFFPNGDSLGHQLRVDALKDDGAPLTVASPQSSQQRQIIGVVADSRNNGLEHPAIPAIYVPYTAFMWDYTQLFIRTSNEPIESLRAIQIALHTGNGDQKAIAIVPDLEEALQHQPVWTQQHLFSILFSCFGTGALLLSLVGLGSTLAFAIAQRRSEFGIRMALGAQRDHIIWIASKATLTTVVSGVGLGLLLNVFIQKAIRHWTPDSIAGPWVLADVTLLLLICTLALSLVLAAQAAVVHPAQTLRCE